MCLLKSVQLVRGSFHICIEVTSYKIHTLDEFISLKYLIRNLSGMNSKILMRFLKLNLYSQEYQEANKKLKTSKWYVLLWFNREREYKRSPSAAENAIWKAKLTPESLLGFDFNFSKKYKTCLTPSKSMFFRVRW